jgi:hypothetical protein
MKLTPSIYPTVGKILVDSITDALLLDPSVDHLYLHVQTSNKSALKFYNRIGFKTVERIDGYYKLNKGVEPPDAYLLQLDLKDLRARRKLEQEGSEEDDRIENDKVAGMVKGNVGRDANEMGHVITVSFYIYRLIFFRLMFLGILIKRISLFVYYIVWKSCGA